MSKLECNVMAGKKKAARGLRQAGKRWNWSSRGRWHNGHARYAWFAYQWWV